jgi:serine/threonine protein kinase
MLDADGRPAIADFGESMICDSEQNCWTMLNIGTEWMKSPEMLSIAIKSFRTRPNYDRRQKVGAGPASDVWSIGCLFFELMTGEFLFLDPDWSRFFLRITGNNVPLLTEENKRALGDENCVKFLEFVLQLSVRHRPDLNSVIMSFDEMFPRAINGEFPRITIPTIGGSIPLASRKIPVADPKIQPTSPMIRLFCIMRSIYQTVCVRTIIFCLFCVAPVSVNLSTIGVVMALSAFLRNHVLTHD